MSMMTPTGIPDAPVGAPPPPPPPPVAGQVPALRISTASEFGPRGAQLSPNDLYEPPAAIQNAMMTKDKKPFTYTPGIGGKLDLSMIRSPRMARRVAKNANDEGIDGPECYSPSQLQQQSQQQYPQQHSPTVYSQHPISVPVFPQNMQPRSPPVDNVDGTVSRPTVRIETKIQPMMNNPDSPGTPTSPTQVTLAKAPTPWMQKQVQKQEELPEWAKRTNANRQDYSPIYDNGPQQQVPQTPRRVVNPALIQEPKPMLVPVRQESVNTSVPRIEDRPSIFTAMNEPGHHQLMNSTTPHHMSRWGNPIGTSGASYIVPVQVEGQKSYQPNSMDPTSPNFTNRNPTPYNPPNKNATRVQVPMSNQPEPGPLQSNSFRVLQRITGTDEDEIDGEQLRKLQLTEDDKYLMNKFKEQVDGENTGLHNTEDPRYRGSAIPSRAFRYLQNMTDSGDVSSNPNTLPRPANSTLKRQNRNSNSFDDTAAQPTVYIPASQQQVQEPKKYTGGAIPSRSFRLLQAMTAPESVGPDVTDY